MSYTDEQKKQARAMYWQGTPVAEIAEQLRIEKRTLYNWAAQEEWNVLRSESPAAVIAARIAQLMQQPEKSDRQIRELDRLLTHIETMERIRRKSRDSAGAGESGTEETPGRSRKRKKK